MDRERSTVAEARQAVEAIREEARQQLEQKQAALGDAEDANEAFRLQLDDMKAEALRGRHALEQRLADEQKKKAALQLELRRDREALSGAKDALDSLHTDMSRQLQAKQIAVTSAEQAAAAARRGAEGARGELDRLQAEIGDGQDAALRELEQSLNEERRAKVMLDAEIERLRARLAATPGGVQGDSAAVDRLRSERDDARQRQRVLEAELERLRVLLKQREAESASPATKKFTTDAPRPASLCDRRPDIVDDLKEVKGIGPVMERVLNEKGCYHFKQLANFSKRDMEWISAALGSFPDRIERDNWVGQAQILYARKYGQRHDVGEVGVIRSLETMS